MTKPQRNVDVEIVESEVDSPADRAAKLDRYAGDEYSVSISGSGASGNVETNNSQKEWFLEHVSVSVSGSNLTGAEVEVDLHLEDADGNIIVGQSCNPPYGTPLDFKGVKWPVGASLSYDISQTDAAGYTITMHPVYRRSTDSDPSGTTRTTIENWETTNPLTNRWTEDTGLFSTTTASGEVYDGLTAVTSTDANAYIEADPAKVNEPDPAKDTFNYYVRASVGSDSSDKSFAYIWFGVQSTGDFDILAGGDPFYECMVEFNYGEFRLRRIDADGNVAKSGRASPTIGYEANKYYRVKYTPTDSGPKMQLFDPDTGDELGNASFDDDILEGGHHWLGVEAEGTGQVWLDHGYIQS